MQKYSKPDERSRFRLYRKIPPMDWVREALRECQPETVVIYEGPFGSGKTTLDYELSRRGGISMPVVKSAMRPRQPLETAAHCHLQTMTYKEWFASKKASIGKTVVGLVPPYKEWGYWGPRLGITPPTFFEMWEAMEKVDGIVPVENFIVDFLLEDIARTFLVAKRKGIRIVTFQLCSVDARDMLAILEEYCPGITQKAVSFALSSPVELRATRILERAAIQRPNTDPRNNLVARVKCLEGAAMPWIPCTLHPQHRIDTSGKVDDALMEISAILGVNSTGGGQSARRTIHL